MKHSFDLKIENKEKGYEKLHCKDLSDKYYLAFPLKINKKNIYIY